ncbi:hypothetical protein SAMN05444413_101240 [Roseivivax marinus]|uniref:hypothetical protein n=1 Tax=Roseivivax marinus TaxID=1379903 RepID=UPI0008B916FA|nr:hypothetical protein [Roseivivax marinus]SEK27960.1 hypothetical protein SAMN05444413_101240 [Roseivivax marinus]
MIRVDLNSRIIDEGHKVFMVRPGANYRLYDLFRENEAIFADIVALDLKQGISFDDQDRILAQLQRSRNIRAHLLRPSGDAPSRDLDHYQSVSRTSALAQLLRVLRGYFEQAKKGDLVLVPPSAFSLDALVGEIQDEPNNFKVIEYSERYGNERLYGRRVRWLGKVQKGKLSPYLLDLISKPNAFVQIRRQEAQSIYRIAYGSYADESDVRVSFTVDDPDFTISDDLKIQAFFNFVAVNLENQRKGRPPQSVEEAIFSRDGDSFELQSNIHSPGYLNLVSKATGPLTVAALFLLATQLGPEAVDAAGNDTVIIGNSKDPNDVCTAEVSREVLSQLRLLGAERWAKACEIANDAALSSGLKGPATIDLP